MKGFVRVLAVAVSVALILVVGWKLGQGRTGADAAACAGKVTDVRGIVGSEKEPFLRDPRVAEVLKCAGLRLRIDPSGSREMVDLLASDSARYDFAFPSSTPTAEKIKAALNVKESFKPFSSVMGVATFKDTAAVLRRAGVVQTVGGQDVISVSRLIALDRAGTSWKKLPGNGSSPNGNVVLMRTTDPADSNSAIMFLSIVSAVLNGDKPVASAAAVKKVLPDMCRLMADQGLKPDTSGVLFEEYLTGGPTRTPIALVYESQFLDKVSSQRVPRDGQHVLLFPSPTVYAWHELVPLSDGGRKVGELLRDDPTLKDLAAEYGFRPQGRTLADRPNPPVVVEPPAYKILETLLDEATGCSE